jgi:hypothetical protein
MEQADWQDTANELSDGMREVRTALDNYQLALNKAYDQRKLLGDDKEFLEQWRIAESGLESTDDCLRDMVSLVDYIEEYLS